MFKVIRTIIGTHNMYKTFKKQGSITFHDKHIHDLREITDEKEIKHIIKTVIIRSIKVNLFKIKLKEMN